jgi:hypothetical protein
MNKILLRSSTPGTCHLSNSNLSSMLMTTTSFQRKRSMLDPCPSHDTPKLTASCYIVLLYLEGMQSNPPEPDDRDSNPPTSPRSQTAPARVTSPMLRGSNSGGSGARRSGRSELSYVTDKRQNGLGLNGVLPSDHGDEIRSDVQEARDSEVGTSVPIRTTGHVSVHLASFWLLWRLATFLGFNCFRPRWSLALKMAPVSDTNLSALPLETWVNPLGINE